jgi:hypothetical protein
MIFTQSSHSMGLYTILLSFSIFLLPTLTFGQQNQQQQSDISISIADASLNSASKVLSVSGAFDYNGKVLTNTTLFRKLLPCAFQSCPKCELDASVVFLEAPLIQFSKVNGASASVSGAIVTFLVNGTAIATASANASTILNFSQSIQKNGYIKVHVKVVELYIDIEDDCSGTIISPSLQVEMNAIIDALCT